MFNIVKVNNDKEVTVQKDLIQVTRYQHNLSEDYSNSQYSQNLMHIDNFVGVLFLKNYESV